MKYLEESIENYVSSDEPYMLLIDGNWGSGKTYYIQNKSIPKLTEKGYKVIYSSVYGKNTLEEIKESIFTKILYYLTSDNKITGFLSDHEERISTVFKVFGKGKLEAGKLIYDAVWDEYKEKRIKDSDRQLNNMVIIIDDLERISEHIKIKDCLGFLLTEILENLGIRIILISNTEAIKEQDEFNKIKEKVINRTLLFSYGGNVSTLSSIIEESDNDFLKGNKEWVIDIVRFALHVNEKETEEKSINIRIFLSVISNFKFIVQKISEKMTELLAKNELNTEIQKTLFLNILVITLEYKKGRLSRENLTLLDRYYGNKYIMHSRSKDEDKDIIEKYYDINESFDTNILFRESVTQYIMFGYFIDENYVSDWLEIFHPSQELISNYDKLSYFKEMSEEELKQVQTDLIFEVKDDQFGYEKLQSIYIRLKEFERLELLLISEEDMKELNSKLISSFKEEVDSLDFDHMMSLNNQTFNNVVDSELKEQIDEIKNSHEDKSIKELVEDIFDKNFEGINSYKTRQGIYRINIFEIINDNDLVDKYILSEGSRAHHLESYISSEYLQIANVTSYHSTDEIKDVEALINSIESKKSAVNLDKVDNYKVESLLNILKQTIEHLNTSN